MSEEKDSPRREIFKELSEKGVKYKKRPRTEEPDSETRFQKRLKRFNEANVPLSCDDKRVRWRVERERTLVLAAIRGCKRSLEMMENECNEKEDATYIHTSMSEYRLQKLAMTYLQAQLQRVDTLLMVDPDSADSGHRT